MNRNQKNSGEQVMTYRDKKLIHNSSNEQPIF